MKTAIDSSVLSDILKSARLAIAAQRALEETPSPGGLRVCDVVIAELGRYFAKLEYLSSYLFYVSPTNINLTEAACTQLSHSPSLDPGSSPSTTQL